jgi:hypothetical protein
MVTRRQVRRATRPSLLGTAARTAVITKTATTVAGNSAAKQQAAMAQQSAAAASGPATTPEQEEAAPQADRFAALRELGELREAGILTEEEFEAEKAKILNG